MKKQIFLFNLSLTFYIASFAQVVESEKINWDNLPAFSCKSFTFKTEQLNYECKDCRYVEFKTISGVSGYFLLGQSSFSIPSKEIDGSSTALMLRLNPKDSTDFLSIVNPSSINDNGFISLSLLVLNDIFRRCYHSGMDALIPHKGNYTTDIFSDKDGDMLVAYADGKLEIFNGTKQKK